VGEKAGIAGRPRTNMGEDGDRFCFTGAKRAWFAREIPYVYVVDTHQFGYCPIFHPISDYAATPSIFRHFS